MARTSSPSRAPFPACTRRVLALVASLALACAGDGPTNALPTSYRASLTGAGEVPPSKSLATGSATIDVHGATATYVVTASAFSTLLTLGHIHIGGAGSIGPVVVPFTITAQAGVVATGTIDLSRPVTYNTLTISGDSLRRLFDAGAAYVNLHTAAFPGGEIRGQLVLQR